MVSSERVGGAFTYFHDCGGRASGLSAGRGIGGEKGGCEALIQSFELRVVLENGGIAWWEHC